jgi:hypothetical protein
MESVLAIMHGSFQSFMGGKEKAFKPAGVRMSDLEESDKF